MSIRRETVTDGITSETRIHIGAPRTPAELRKLHRALRVIVEEQNRRATFNGRVVDLERTCRRTPGIRRDPRQPQPKFGSRAWYAEEILAAIQVVRHMLAHDEPQVAASEAVLVGALAAEAEAKFHWGDRLLLGARSIKNRELSQRSAAARQSATADRDKAIVRESLAYRRRHPTHSTRAMAASIAGPLDMKIGTIRDRLRRLRIR